MGGSDDPGAGKAANGKDSSAPSLTTQRRCAPDSPVIFPSGMRRE
jgi:hypothetical protein